ncbi:hypothetical protein, partial [Acidisphaera rubrifaciens]|uniref:hypothetical protein n=1 Tax=Acidisphaera rubrifaciens TaxID=50715 RepID=UPI000661FBCA
ECLCAGPNDLWLGTLTYEEHGAGRVARLVSFLPDLRHLASVPGPGDPRVTLRPTPAGDVAHVVVRPDQTLLLNAPAYAVTPGAGYTLTVPVLNRLGTDVYGNVTLIWLDAAGHGLHRDDLVVRPAYAGAGETVSDAAGAFRLARPPGPVRLTVPDQNGHRAAIATLLP